MKNKTKTKQTPSYCTTVCFSCMHETLPNHLEAAQVRSGIMNSTASFPSQYPTIIFHRSAHLMLSKLERAWAECNFFPCVSGQNWEIPIPQHSHLHLLSQVGFWISLWSQRGNALCGEKNRRQAGWGLQSKLLCWHKCSAFQMVGEGSLLRSSGKNCIAKYLPGASSLLLRAIVLPSSTPCLAQKFHLQDRLEENIPPWVQD